MKTKIMIMLFLVTAVTGFSQQKNYGVKKIGQWTFEKFPLHYSAKPFKTITYKNRISGKLEGYEELNQFGQTDGLKLTMYSDGTHPYSAIYVYKGETVYSVTYFPNSNKANYIATYNEKGEKDGYYITRTLKETGGYNEEIEKYENGLLVSLNGVQQTPFSVVYKDSLLEGQFKFNSGPFVIEGMAEKGKLKNIKQTQNGIIMSEITFQNDSLIIKEPLENKQGFDIQKYRAYSMPTITNSISICLKYGNYNGFPFFVLPKDFKIWDLKEIALRRFPDSLISIDNYSDSLLDGDFQYRQYKISSNYSNDERIDIFGVAEKGKLVQFIMYKVGYDNLGKFEVKFEKYIFKDGEILLYDLDLETGAEKTLLKKMKLQNPVLLTNSVNLGGTISYYDSSWENKHRTLGIPIKREGTLTNNIAGYFFFSPTTFEISNFLMVVD